MNVGSSTRGLPPEGLDAAFPFHLAVDRDARVVQFGPSLARALPTLRRGDPFDAHFLVKSPAIEPTPIAFLAAQGELFQLQARARDALVLRAQAVPLAEEGVVAFLGSPWVTDLQSLLWLGLSLDAFALHDPVCDYLLLLQAQKLSIAESDRLTRELGALNAELEARVRDRTSALEEANVKLTREIADRQRVEVELRHAQKLEAVGQLAGGVAHEINTPVQYVGDSVHFLKSAHDDLLALVGVCQGMIREAARTPAHRAFSHGLAAAEETADLAYPQEQVPKAFDRAFDGISRVASIVRAMKEFAHPDHREMASADLVRALENTLLVARNEYKQVAEVATDFAPLPPVVCHVGDLNQVFLNLVVNAAHAIGDVVGASGALGRIDLRAWRDGDHAVITIADTGSGIPEAIRDRIFEPFFTTKEVGRGTGQGLAIARSIVVDRHHGSLSFTSEVGRGTTFTIRLPIEGHNATREAA